MIRLLLVASFLKFVLTAVLLTLLVSVLLRPKSPDQLPLAVTFFSFHWSKNGCVQILGPLDFSTFLDNSRIRLWHVLRQLDPEVVTAIEIIGVVDVVTMEQRRQGRGQVEAADESRVQSVTEDLQLERADVAVGNRLR